MQLVRSRSPRGRLDTQTRLVVGLLASILLMTATVVSATTVERIKETGTLRMGYVENARPFSYLDGSGKPKGYTVALCERVAGAIQGKLGIPTLKSEFVKVPFEQRFSAVQQGKVDLLCAAGAVTLKRRQDVSFSIPVFPSGVGALMRRDAPRRMRQILAGEPEPERPRWRASLGQILEKRVFAVHSGTETETWLEGRIDDMEIIATIDPVDSFDLGVDRVLARRADVFFAERDILLDAAKRSPSSDDLLVLDRYFTYEPLALSVQRGDEDFRLLVDSVLSGLYRGGEIDQIYTPYFGEPSDQTRQFFERAALPE